MAGSMSNYAEAALIDHLLRNSAYTSVATVYLGLFTDDPTDAGTGTEVTGGSYAREAIAFDAAASRTLDNTSDITFTTATANWGTVSHWGVYDHSTGGSGNLLAHGDFTAGKAINSGDTAKVLAGELDITFSAGGLTTTACNSWLDRMFRNQAYASPTTVYVCLFTSSPGDDASGTEVTDANNYSRQAETFTDPSGAGATENDGVLTFPTATGTWGDITHFGIYDSSTHGAGNQLFWGALDSSVNITTDDVAEWASGALDVTVD